MRVLVTGATGFIGRHLIPQLLSRGHTVTAVARNKNKAHEFDWFNDVDFSDCNIHTPIENPFKLFGRPEAVIHLAWPGLPNYNDLFHFEENLPAQYQFLKSLVEGGVGHLLVSGTCFEYGMQSGALVENMPAAPVNPYALAKDTLRKFLQSLQQSCPFTLQWARLFYMYGSGQNPNSLLAQLDRAIDSGESVFNMSGGEQLRDYLAVENVAAGLVTLMMHPQCSGVINVCSGEPISIRRLVEQHIARRGSDIQLNLGYYSYPHYEPMAFWGDVQKISLIIGKT